MKILISNDDGFKAKGIRILDSVLSASGHEVFAAAPSEEQSGKSHGFSISGRIRVCEYAPGHYHFAGTPADCIIYSHRASFFPSSFDAVVSGINHGYNLSGDVLYSGTCAAARQAALYGMKAIAVSTAPGADEALFRRAALFITENLDTFLSAIPLHSFMNINIPLSFDGTWERADLGFTTYVDDVVAEEDEDGEKYLRIVSTEAIRGGADGIYPADSDVCRRGHASVSIVRCLPVADYEGMGNIR